MSWRLTIRVEDERDVMDDLVFQREADGDIPTCVVAVDAPRAGTAVEIRVDQTDTREGHQVDAVIETNVVAGDSGEGDLEEIAYRTDQHHRSDGEVPIDVIVEIESERQHGAIDCS